MKVNQSLNKYIIFFGNKKIIQRKYMLKSLILLLLKENSLYFISIQVLLLLFIILTYFQIWIGKKGEIKQLKKHNNLMSKEKIYNRLTSNNDTNNDIAGYII